MTRCTALPVYDYYSNNLKRIEIERDPIQVYNFHSNNYEHTKIFGPFWQDLEQNITDSISANIVSYAISVVPVESVSPEINVTLLPVARSLLFILVQ